LAARFMVGLALRLGLSWLGNKDADKGEGDAGSYREPYRPAKVLLDSVREEGGLLTSAISGCGDSRLSGEGVDAAVWKCTSGDETMGE
jgi:hypothetical protein